ncbi:hypothetical protein ILUMI_01214 [Ignelater luminosus]|uniref:Protein SERAC1 n=1 Tax=Ignelater luminosus TaxID=2038154 RepID=A0A8K0DKG3_IGNLU|nr:hypothetical protein ILUMI_01214 [Ignelater luminosus]
MEFYRKHRKFIKISGIIISATGVGWIITQINKTYRTLNSVLDTSVIHFMEPMKHVDHKQKVDDNFVLINWIKTYDNNEQAAKKGWNSLKFAYARRLLNMTNSENSAVRRRAVKQLAEIKNLDNWHYSLLAHILDARTAVGLARTEDVDPRFFIQPPYRYLSYNHEMIINSMKEFLIALNNRSKHSCMTYFINRAFFDQDAERLLDNESVSTELRRLIQSANDILPLCLESLLHHSTVKDYAKDIVLLNGLSLLMEIHNRFKNNPDINIILCNILSNISMYPELLENIYRTGWIGVLAEWVKESDIRISAPAARTLANLDSDDEFDAVYPQRMYVLHPMLRSDQNTNVDVVFVHGLLGGVFFTWRQRDRNETTIGFLGKKKGNETITAADANLKFMRSSDPAVREYIEGLQTQQQLEWDQLGQDFEFVLNDVPVNTNENATGPYTCPGNHQCVKQETKDSFSYTQCWPKDWLPEDCRYLRVIGVNYDTSLSMWAPICPAEQTKTTLEERSNEFLEKLLKAGVGQRSIIWVTHSMGGLLVKNILCKASESNSQELKNLCSNTKAIVFYSTPHIGSRLANLSQPTALVLWPSVEIQELREESPGLLQIHNKFLNVTNSYPIKIVSFVETKSTLVTAMKFNLLLVDPRSANPTVGEFFEIPQDHLGICKPANRQSFLYQKVLNLIKEFAEDPCTIKK